MRVPTVALLLGIAVPAVAGQPPPVTPPVTPAPAPAAAASMQAPRMPPFAGAVVNFDRRGEKVVACVDASAAAPPGKPGAPAPKPTGPAPEPRYRIWVIEREVMQELLTTAGLCDPMWSPDGTRFAAAGQRGVFVFTAPNFEPTALVAGLGQPPAPGDPAPRQFDDPVWSPGGGRVAFRVSGPGTTPRVEVVDVKSAEVLLRKDGAIKVLRWADERALLLDGTRVPLP